MRYKAMLSCFFISISPIFGAACPSPEEERHEHSQSSIESIIQKLERTEYVTATELESVSMEDIRTFSEKVPIKATNQDLRVSLLLYILLRKNDTHYLDVIKLRAHSPSGTSWDLYNYAISHKDAFESYLQLASDRGLAPAQCDMGAFLESRGSRDRYVKAFNLYTLADKQGYAEAQTKLGYMYQTGRGTTRDYKAAMDCYVKAAKRGHPDANYRIGYLYEKGLGVDRDLSTAEAYYSTAMLGGSQAAIKASDDLKKTNICPVQ